MEVSNFGRKLRFVLVGVQRGCENIVLLYCDIPNYFSIEFWNEN